MIASKRVIKPHHALPHDDVGALNFSVFKTDSKANTLQNLTFLSCKYGAWLQTYSTCGNLDSD